MAGMGLALAAMGFVGTCMWRRDQSMNCFHTPMVPPRGTTTAVLTPHFSGSLLADLLCGSVSTLPKRRQH